MTFEDMLKRDGRLVYKTKGYSMNPMLYQNRDVVVISAKEKRLKKHDVAFYRRGNDHILHRVIKVRENDYLIRGDNTYRLEIVPEEDVLGVLTAFVRNGKEYSCTDTAYLRYVRFWCAVYPFRAVCVSFLRGIKRVLKKLGVKRRK